MNAMSIPECVYRLSTQAEWAQALETRLIPKRDIDERDGYFHLSTRDQVLETARLHFADADGLLALEMMAAPIVDHLKFELAPKRGEAFPHYYGDLRASQVRAVIEMTREGDGFAFGKVR